MSPTLLRSITKLIYVALLVYIPLWNYFIASNFNWYLTLLFWWVPLLPALHGILKNNYYTMSWASFLLLIPFCHGLMVWLTVAEESRWGMVEVILTGSYYIGFFFMMSSLKKQASD